MKNLIATLALILISPVAFAYPAVNDSASYQGVYVQDGTSLPLTLSTTLTAFDAVTGQYKQTDTQTLGGQTDSKESLVDQGDLVTPELIQNILTNCAAQGGAPEVVKTGLGPLDTCKISSKDADTTQIYWFADVPFGIARFFVDGKNDDGSAYQIGLTLATSTRGQ